MGTSPAESMSIAAQPPVSSTSITKFKRQSKDEESEAKSSNENDSKRTDTTEDNKLESTNEVFDLMKSELKTTDINNEKEPLNADDHRASDFTTEIEQQKTTLMSKAAVSSKNSAVDIALPPPAPTTLPPPTVSPTPVVKKTVLEEHGFTVGNQIGSGTYAKVKVAYSAEHRGPVAIKIISKMKAPTEYLSRFLPREIEVVKGLRHENLIKFYQSIETTHRVYIIMQLAERGSLLDLIRNEKHLENSRSKKYYRQLVSAIDYCHSKGVVHRDIKCENLLLDKEMNLKLIDFGFARGQMFPVNNAPVLSETYCGSYAYASPEVLKGVPYDPHMSDIWASGVVLYAMVYGRLPYDGSNYNHLLKQVQAKLVFPKHPSDIPLECKNLILKILSPLKIRYQIRQIKQDKWLTE